MGHEGIQPWIVGGFIDVVLHDGTLRVSPCHKGGIHQLDGSGLRLWMRMPITARAHEPPSMTHMFVRRSGKKPAIGAPWNDWVDGHAGQSLHA